MSCQRWRSGLSVACGALLFAGEGCSGDALPRQPLTGFVALDGQPLSRGVISFFPEADNDDDVPPVSTGAMIKDGYFSVPRTYGLIPGRYDIAIHAARSSHQRRHPGDRDPANDQRLDKDLIPAKYNAETRLAIDIKDAAIKEITFHLESD
jgi:hypothetical protein